MSSSNDFRSVFGRPATTQASAPGRVNLIGEHTDYQGGYVMPLAIPQRTTVELALRDDDLVRAHSANVDTGPLVREYRLGGERRGSGWLDYVQGVTAVLREAGHALRGFEARIESTVPSGSGLSSSAALQVAALRAVREALALGIDDLALALLAHRAETQFVGAPVGIMDQFACSFADTTHALFLDTRARTWEAIPVPASARILVIDSGLRHQIVSGGYRQRRAEAEAAARALGVAELRDVAEGSSASNATLERVRRLPPPLDRRARHIVTENARVLAATEAMRSGDTLRLGRLLNEAHRSLSEDYEVSLREIDVLAEIARSQPGVAGARLTGGGFGGAVIVLGVPASAPDLAERIADEYGSRTGNRGRVLVAG